VVKQGHLAVMLTVNGIESAQRFTLIEGACAPSLALYTIISPAVLQDAYYLRIRGMGPWLPLIDQRYYRRTLFAGLDIAPAVSNTGVLLVTRFAFTVSATQKPMGCPASNAAAAASLPLARRAMDGFGSPQSTDWQ